MADSLFSDSDQPEAAAAAAALTVPQTGNKRGHAVQPSVGNAATLFGGDADDPFASIAPQPSPTKPASSAQPGLPELTEEQPSASLFGGDSADTQSADDLFGSAQAADTGSTVPTLQVPVPTGSGPSSGPASPGDLFADSSYNEDWLGAGDSAAAASDVQANPAPTAAPAPEAPQDSLDWLGQTEGTAPEQSSQAGAGYEHQNAYGYEGAYDQNAAYGAGETSDGAQYNDPAYAAQGYDNQSYDPNAYGSQNYDAQAYDNQGYDAQAYDSQAYPQQQGQYSDPNYQYDYSNYEQQPATQDQQQYGYSETGNYGQWDQQYASQADGQQLDPSQHAYAAYDRQAYGYDQQQQKEQQPTDNFYNDGVSYQDQTQSYPAEPSQDPYAPRSSYETTAPQTTNSAYGYEGNQTEQSWQGQSAHGDYGYDTAAAAPSELPNGTDQQHQSFSPYQQPPANGVASNPGPRAPSPYDPLPPPPPPPHAMGAQLDSPGSLSTPPPPSLPPPPKGPPRGASRNSRRPSPSPVESNPTEHVEPSTTSSQVVAEASSNLHEAWPTSSNPTWEAEETRGASGLVGQLEEAAATPPPNENVPAPPTLTVTDEDAQDPEATESAEQVNLVDSAVEGLQELDINAAGRPDVDAEDQLDIPAQQDDDVYRQVTEELDDLGLGNTEPSSDDAQVADAATADHGASLDESAAFNDDGYALYEEGAKSDSYGYQHNYSGDQQPTDAPYDPYGPASTNDTVQDPEGGGDPYSYGAYGPVDGQQSTPVPPPPPIPETWEAEGGYSPEDGTAQEGVPAEQPYDPYAPVSGTSDGYANDRYGPNGYGSYDPYEPTANGHSVGNVGDEMVEDTSDARTPSATTAPVPWATQPSSYDPHAASESAPPHAGEVGLDRQDTVTQRSFSRQSHSRTGSGWSQPPSLSVGSGTGQNPYGPTYAEPEQYGTQALPRTPIDGEPVPSHNSYFEVPAGRYDASPYGASQRSVTGAPASPYDPSTARSYTSDASHSRSTSDMATDMADQMRHAKIPLACFGVGGKLITYFPSPSASTSASAGAAYAYGIGTDASTQVTLHSLAAVIPSSSYASAFDPLQFPGPAFDGSSTSTNALSRATGAGSASNKAKKSALIKHLDDRIQEVSAGLGYLRRAPSFYGNTEDEKADAASSGATSLECKRVEDKVTLLRLLKSMLEHDGQTSNNPAFDASVREVLNSASKDTLEAKSSGSLALSPATGGAQDNVLRSYELTTGFLQKLQSLLLQGQRREAVDLAVRESMWAHAMAIASCVDKDCWKSVVGEFIQHELGVGGEGDDLHTLKVAYNLFSGQDPVSIFDLFRTKSQFSAGAPQPQPSPSNGADGAGTASPDWRAAAALVLSNKSPGDSAALTAIGDGLVTRGLIEAAHACYLLAPQTSPLGGVDSTAVRMTLLGSPSPKVSNAYVRDLDSIIMTEILEFAQSLVPVTKGQEHYGGIPHLQAYRLLHAYQLAELGDLARAQKYCEAIAGTLKLSKNSPYLHRALLSQVKELSDRLVGAPQIGGNGTNWVTRKMQRPTLDGVWASLEGRFTKFIAGEDGSSETSSPAKSKGSGQGGNETVGPFSHYSAITPDAASGGMTRQQSYADFGANPSVPTSRAGSAMDFHQMARAASPKNRASSAMGMRPALRDPFSEWPQPLTQLQPDNTGDSRRTSNSFEAMRSGHALQSSEYSTMSSTYGADSGAHTSYGPTDNTPWYGADSAGPDSRKTSLDQRDRNGSYGVGGGSEYGQDGAEGGDNGPYYGYQSHGAPQSQFLHNVEGSSLETADDGAGFVSPMDAFSGVSKTPRPPSQTSYRPSMESRGGGAYEEEEDEDDDLGLGNSSNRKKKQQQAPSGGDASGGQAAQEGAKEEEKPQEEEKKQGECG